jgi:hypothetical protein
VDLVRGARARWGVGAATGLAVLLLAASAPFVLQDVRELRVDLDVVRAESELYDRLGPIVAKAGGRDALLRCGPVYTPPYEVQAVAWAMHVHSWQVGIFAAPPGTTLGGHFSALGHDPRFPELTKNRRWSVGRNCREATP